jgi:hypothetical protein
MSRLLYRLSYTAPRTGRGVLTLVRSAGDTTG